MQEKVYKNYTSIEKLELTCKDHFTEKAGFPNEFAFLDFAQQIKREDEMYLVCLNVDLRKANRISYAFGSYTLRKFMVSLEGFYVFRIQGEKLNIFVPESGVQELKSILDAPNEFIDVYYGFVPEYFDAADLDQQRSVGVELMYQDKAKKHSKAKSGDSLLAGKGNTPVGLQETFERKYKETMWYSVAKIAVTSPVFKEVTVHIFPTEFRSPMESLPLIVVVDDLLEYRVMQGKDVHFGVEGIVFSVSARYDREGHLNTAVYQMKDEMMPDEPEQCELEIRTHEGSCVPANFGKRISSKREIYPIRKNIQGYMDYVLLENGTAVINTEGVIEKKGKLYGVFSDDNYVELIPIS